MTAGAKAVLARRYDASPAEVFAACTRPDLLARWLGPNHFEICEVEAEVRIGGRFAFRMKNADGVLGAQGIYREIVDDVRIVLSWQWIEGTEQNPADGVISEVVIDLTPDGDGTMLTLTHAGLPDQEQADSHEHGWSEALAKLEALFARDRSDR